jgi:hypothetical protein
MAWPPPVDQSGLSCGTNGQATIDGDVGGARLMLAIPSRHP